jgi:hypothetical protein
MSTAPQRQGAAKHIVCVSWLPALARTRELLFTDAGWRVTSIVGAEQLSELRITGEADLLVLAHSVPRNEKQLAIQVFRQYCKAPVLSLLEPYQSLLREADFGVEAISPAAVIDAVRNILNKAL